MTRANKIEELTFFRQWKKKRKIREATFFNSKLSTSSS